MRLLQIVPSLESRHGGPSVSVPALAGGLARLGHEVGLLSTARTARRESAAGPFTIELFRREWPRAFCPSAGLRRRLQEGGADVLHSHGLWLRPLHYAHCQARRSAVPHVISPRGMMAPWAWRRHRMRKAAAAWLIHPGALAAAHGWHATSAAEADDIRNLGFSQPVCVAPNGVGDPLPADRARAEVHWRAACPEAFQRPTALFYSRLHPKKRVLELLDLWMEQAPADWLLLVVGIPEAYTVAQLRSYVHRNRGDRRVRIFDGGGVPAPYEAASLFLLPSHSENFGLVVAEALAHGLPAIVTDSTPWSALHAAGHGWCVPWAQFGEALRDAVTLGRDALRARGTAARAWVLAEYSWEKCAGQLASFYEELRRP